MTTQTILEENARIEVSSYGLDLPIEVRPHPRFAKPLEVTVRQGTLLGTAPWVRSLGKLGLEVTVQGWKFPLPPDLAHNQAIEANKADPTPPSAATPEVKALPCAPDGSTALVPAQPVPLSPVGLAGERTHLRPPRDTVLIRDRLLYLLQPPLESMFSGCKITLPFPPFPYQVKGIAFLMPRSHALIADEMGLGKTAQVILALRLLFNAGLIQNTLIV